MEATRPTPDLIATLKWGEVVTATFQPNVTDDLIAEAIPWVGVDWYYRVIGGVNGKPVELALEDHDDFFGFRAPPSDFVNIEKL
jgi:hypothetical protein